MYQYNLKKIILFSLHVLVLSIFFYVVPIYNKNIHAQSSQEISQKIKDILQQKETLQKEIDALSGALNTTTAQAQTYANALKALNLTQQKLEKNLKLTSTNLSETILTLRDLENEIFAIKKDINLNSDALSQNIKDMSVTESDSFIENFLKEKTLSNTFDYINALKTIQNKVNINLNNLRDTEKVLSLKKDAAESQKNKLENYKKTLSDQKKVVEYNQDEKARLEAEAKKSAASYASRLELKKKEAEAFEKELFAYESQLQIILDPNAIPGARVGVLGWPLETNTCSLSLKNLGNSFCITQFFGKTAAARKLYKNTTHGGIDFRATIGTPIKTALSGTVVDVETKQSGCQYGKYVLVKHANGLSTVYGHLSVVSVKSGDIVITGQTIGYSGSTGYSTGPHLHFGVYASAGIKVVDSGAFQASCRGIKTIAATPAAYLDPLSYLPKI